MKKTQQQAAELLAELERSARDARQNGPLVNVCIRAAAGERVPVRDWSVAVAISVGVGVVTRAVRALQKPRARARRRRR